MDFTPATVMRTWRCAGFRIELHDSPRPPDGTHLPVGYRLLDDVWSQQTGADALIFAGDDLGVTGHAVDSLATIHTLGRFLSCRPGDVDAQYFAAYTPAQIAWRDSRAEDLARCCEPGAAGDDDPAATAPDGGRTARGPACAS